VAQIGAAIGREFSYRLIATVAKISAPSLQSAIDQLANCGLIWVRGEPPDASYIFNHALVQDTAYATMVRSKRQELHARIADALMVEFPETVEAQPELMAYHLEQAGLIAKAVQFLRKARRHAIEHSAHGKPIERLTPVPESLQGTQAFSVRIGGHPGSIVQSNRHGSQDHAVKTKTLAIAGAELHRPSPPAFSIHVD
jgi:hypothetical protein